MKPCLHKYEVQSNSKISGLLKDSRHVTMLDFWIEAGFLQHCDAALLLYSLLCFCSQRSTTLLKEARLRLDSRLTIYVQQLLNLYLYF